MNANTYAYEMEAPVTQPPRRVVSLVPSVTESLFDLNLGDRLIAITDYCVHPAEKVAALPRIGGPKNPDVPRIIAMRPDLVIANREENHKAAVLALRAAGIPVWVTFPRTVLEAINLLWNIMHVFDEPVMVPRVRLLEQTYDWVLRLGENREQPLKVFVPIWLDPLMTFNADTYCHDVLRVCGGTNVFADRRRLYPLAADLGAAEPETVDNAERDTRYPRVTLGEVAAAQPDVILLPSEPFPFTEEHRPLFAALAIPAARNNRIHLVDGSLITWHGTRLAYALNTLPALLSTDK
ncbi:MAG TPA: helical backbone metal receptor [Phototrophicaceae bacterium]|nr:helical backbone metal receptor [Phototrophicaceae bacterium]